MEEHKQLDTTLQKSPSQKTSKKGKKIIWSILIFSIVLIVVVVLSIVLGYFPFYSLRANKINSPLNKVDTANQVIVPQSEVGESSNTEQYGEAREPVW